MRPEDIDYIKHRMSRAVETLDEAEHLLTGGFLAGVVNRLYYACFYAVSALLLSEGQASSKHSGVMSMFDRFWIKPGRLPAELGAFYHLIFEKRQKGDYEDMFALERTELDFWLRDARDFVQQVRESLIQVGLDIE